MQGPKKRRTESWWQYLGGWVNMLLLVLAAALFTLVFATLADGKRQDVQIAQQQSVTRTQFVQDFESRTPAERRVAAQFLIELDKQGSGFDPSDYGDNTVQLLQRTVATGEVPAIDTHVAPVITPLDKAGDYWYVWAVLAVSWMLGFSVSTFNASEKRYLADMPRGFIRRVLFVAATPTFWPFYLVSWLRMRKYGFAPSEDAEPMTTAAAS